MKLSENISEEALIELGDLYKYLIQDLHDEYAAIVGMGISQIQSLRAELTASRDREEKAANLIGLAKDMTSEQEVFDLFQEWLASYESSRAEKKEKYESI